MKLRSWLSLGMTSVFAFAAASIFAQAEPPKTDPPAQEQEPDEETIPIKWNELTLGYSSFKANSGLSQYARPAEGLSIHEFRLFSPGTEKTPYARLTMRGLSPQDSVIDGYLVLNRGNTVLRGNRRQHGYYDLDWRPKNLSEDNITELTVDHSLAPNVGGFVRYESSERDGRYAAPREPDHMRTRTFAAGVGGDLLGGNLNVTASDRRSFDDTGVQPGRLQQRIDASYTRDIGSALTLEGSAGYAKIEQAGWASSYVKSYALAGAFDLGPDTTLQFHMGRQDLDLNAIQNAWVRKRLLTSARLMHRFPGWSLQFGFKHREWERVRADQSFVDVPKVNEYDARLAGKLGSARLTLRGSWADLRDTAVMNSVDPRQMLWDDRAMFQAKMDGGNDVFTAYGVYTYKFQQNKQRGVDIRWNNFVVGGSYTFSPALNGYLEFASDDYAVGGGAESGQPLDFYFPGSRSIAFGLNWAKDARFSASANLNYYETGDMRGTQLTLSLRRALSPDHDLELVIAPWHRQDRALDLTGYRTTFLMAKYTVRF